MITPQFEFGTIVLNEALEIVKKRNMHLIHCSFSGLQIGHVCDEEVRAILKMELAMSPLLQARQLARTYRKYFYLHSTSPAPIFKYTNDKAKFLHILKQDSRGANRLFGYLIGKFLFEHMQREKLIHTSHVHELKMRFLIKFQKKLDTLLEVWWMSLTPEDELRTDSMQLLQDLIGYLNLEENQRNESKDAQRCLEALMALDGIYNLRSRFFYERLRVDVNKFLQKSDWTFHSLLHLLKRVMTVAFHRSMNTKRTPQGDARSISLALEALSLGARRTSAIQDKIFNHSLAGRLGPNSTGRQILNEIESTIKDNGEATKLSKSQRTVLTLLVRKLEAEVETLSWSDKRLESYKSILAKRSQSLGNVKVIRGHKATKNLVGALEAQNIKPPEHILRTQKQLEIKHRERLDANRVRQGKRPVGRPKSARSQAFHDTLNAMFGKTFVIKPKD